MRNLYRIRHTHYEFEAFSGLQGIDWLQSHVEMGLITVNEF